MRGAFPVVGLALVVLLGIRLGVVTPTEAAAAAALYARAAAAGLRGPRGIAAAFARSAGEASAVGLLVGTAAPLVFLLAVDGVPAAVSGLLSGLGPFGVLVASNLVLLAAGCVLDIGAAILLFAPILLPAATAAGVDPVAAGVLLVVNLMIGGLTPPVGVLVYVAASLTGQKAGAVFRACLPFVAALLAALLLMGAVVGALAR
jgi:TRAP-type C4-dicarboxylate transport system permease large subunit